MFGLGTWEILVVLIVLLLLFGSRLPSVMRGLGKSVTEFKRGMNEITDEPEPPQRRQSQPPSEQSQQAQGEAKGQEPDNPFTQQDRK